MADLEKTVSIIFSGVDKTGAVFTGIGRNLEQFSGKIQTVTQPLADVASGVLKTEAALAALAAGGLAYAYSKSIEFEGAAIELKRVMDNNAVGFDTAKESAIDLSNKFGISATSILSSTADFKQAGYNIDEAMQLTEASLKLVTASELDTNEASRILVATLKGFGAPVSDVNRLMDIFNYTSSISATSVGELATGMSVLSPLASQMGYSFEEMAGLLTPIIEVFGSGSEAANALKIGLLNLGTSTGPVKEAFEKLKIEQRNSNGEMKSAKELMTEVQAKFASLTDVQKTNITMLLAGKNQASRMAIAFDGLGKTTEIVTKNLKYNADSINNEVVIALGSGEKAVDRFKVGFENMSIAVGAKFQDAATNAISGATDIEIALQKLIKTGAFDDLLSVVSGMSNEMGDLFKGIAKALPEALKKIDWSGFTGSIQGLGDTIGDLFSAFFDDADLTTAEGLADAIQKIIDAGTILTNVTKGIISVFEPFVGFLGDAIDYFDEGGPDAQEFAGQILGIGAALTGAAGLTALLAAATKGVGGLLGKMKLLKALGSLAIPIMISIEGGKLLADLVYNLIPGLEKADKKAFKVTVDFIGDLYGFLIGQNVDQVGEWGKQLGRWLGDALMKAVGETTNFRSIQSDFKGMNLEMTAYIETHTDFESVQSDWDAITDEMENFSLTPETDFDGIQSDWDAITDELGTVDADVKVDVDDKSIRAAQDRIKKAFTKSSMGPIDLPFDFGGGGSGMGAVTDGLKDAVLDMEPIDIGEAIDMSGLSDLMDSLAGIENYADKQQMTDEAFKIAQAQRELMQAEAKNLNTRNAILQQETQNITRMEGTQNSTIKIEASGLEPEMEAFMWKLLKKIQVRANAAGAEFLLAAT